MSDGYQVNTDELEAVAQRLRGIQQNLGRSGTTSRYDTVVARRDFGGDFHEADALASAHDRMQQFLAEVIAELDGLIDDFGAKTRTVSSSYRAREEDGAAAMGGQQGSLA
ncbi:hypothetical protein ABT095_18640 [Kitasatospora sp. NPDC002227]|uniref:hypothetical protein n=1 Tax=Kitasatospora sp. NPDC002227 TaxID=3154773 RepID=UPI003325F5C4